MRVDFWPMSPRLQFAIETAYRAGKSTLAHFRAGAGYEVKSDATPVTVADRGAEQIIRDAIAKAYPGETILGEEQGLTGHSTSRWIVDPIDGTKSFVCGVPLYGTLLSWEEDGYPTIGISYFPALDEMVYAERGQGAFSNGRKCAVNTRDTLEGSFISCGGHKTMIRHNRWKSFEEIIEKAMVTRSWGDCYGYCLVAQGQLDAMIDPAVSRWDLSAVSVIVEEAGGKFTGFGGSDWREPINSDGTLGAVCTNGLLHSQILEIFG